MSYDLKKLRDKFFSDPDWKEMEELIQEYILPFRDVENIVSNKTNDEIASEVRGRQLMVKQLDKFLSDTGIISGRIKREAPKGYK